MNLWQPIQTKIRVGTAGLEEKEAGAPAEHETVRWSQRCVGLSVPEALKHDTPTS